MRQHCIVYSEAARRDITAIGDYIREVAGESIAERFVARIIATVESLEFMPTRHRIRPELGADLRVIGFRKYLIFYTVLKDEVTIVRVLHGARAITARLFSG
jgi:toxin ParE1/3/4